MCTSCDELRRARRIRSAEEYYQVVEDVRARVRDGTLRLLQGSCALSQIGPGRPWPSERMSHVFICRQCSARFQLTFEPVDTKGGAWTPLDGAIQGTAPAPGSLAARLAVLDWKTIVTSALIAAGWWLIIVGVLSVSGLAIAAWLTPAALLMAIPVGRHCAATTRGREPEDRRLNALVAGGLLGSDLGLILAVWAAFVIPGEFADAGTAALLVIVLTAAGAAGGAALAGYGASRVLRAEGDGTRINADGADWR